MEKQQIHKPPYGPLLIFVLLAILIGIAYFSSLDVPWHFDDKTNIVDNSWIQIVELSPSELAGTLNGQLSGVLRQSSYLGFALNYYFANAIFGSGLDPMLWHIVNIILHVLTSYLIFLLTFDLLKRARGDWEESTRFWLAFMTAVFFALNPIQTQTVTYIVQRMAGAAAFWYLLTLYLYIKHRASEKKQTIPFLGNFPLLVWIGFVWYAGYYIFHIWIWQKVYNQSSDGQYAVIYLAIAFVIGVLLIHILHNKDLIKRQDGDIYLLLAIPAGLIALTTKENTITLPFFCWFYDYLFISGNDESFRKRSLLGWGFIAGFLLLISPVLWDKILVTYEERDFTVWERVLTQFRVVWNYLLLMIYPHPSRLNLDIEIVKSTSVISPVSTFFAIIAWFAAVITSIKYLKKDRFIPFLILWYFGQLIIESSFIGLEMVYEHRFYLPGWGAILLVVYGIFALFRYLTKDMKTVKPSMAFSGIISIILIVTSVVCISWTIERNAVWADELVFWKDVVAKSPSKERPKVNLGFLLERNAEYILTNHNQIKTRQDAERQQAQALAMFAEAESLYQDALKIDKKSVYALVNLGHLYLIQGDHSRALETFHKAELIDSEDAILQFNIGVTYKAFNQIEKAREHYEKAIELRANYYEALVNLGILEIEDGNIKKGIGIFTEATQISRFPDLAYYNLGNAYVKLNDLDSAEKSYENALYFRPYYLQAMVNLANVFSMQGDFKNSVKMFNDVLKLNPDHINTHYNLGLIYMNNLNQPEEALFHFKRVLQINPNIAQARNVEGIIRNLQGESK